MNCTPGNTEGDGSDRSEGRDGPCYFDQSAVSWLVGEAVRHLNGEGKEAELAYQRAIELLRARDDTSEEIMQASRRVVHDDIGMRWSLLHVLGDVGHARAAGFLVEAALARLPEHDPTMGCEGPRDNEVLIATTAVEALQRVAAANKDTADMLLKVVDARPARPILVEGVKAAVALGLRERLRELLPKEEHWMIDLRRARVEELHAEPEREDGRERGFTPPRGRDLHTGPSLCGCHHHKGRTMATCTYSVPDLNTSGDNLYGPRICSQPFIDWAWEAFDFDRGDWDDGFGYEAVCDNTRALSRTLSGVWCLTYSSPQFPRESYSGNILEWGCRFSRNAIDELDARCGDGSAFAQTRWGPIIDNWTRLFLLFFYGQGVSRRAGTLLHEARHADGKGHDRGNNDSSWGYNGAWRWQVCWLAWFAH